MMAFPVIQSSFKRMHYDCMPDDNQAGLMCCFALCLCDYAKAAGYGGFHFTAPVMTQDYGAPLSG
ncbi:hypothetical protein ECNG_05345 [Escherichia coli TA280]|nr:hypothetical protein ECNG_05345 [Escherichia coli TA280]